MNTQANDLLKKKIKDLCATLWQRQLDWPQVQQWLNNFSGEVQSPEDEQTQALYLLSHFLYFGEAEVRELLRAVYRDLFRARFVRQFRKSNSNTRVASVINNAFRDELRRTRFLGMGNPSESGSFLLYYFRQVNGLPSNLFIHTHQIFSRSTAGASGVSVQLRDPSIKNYIFIDDLCGSGQQAIDYSKDAVTPLKKLNPGAHVAYLPLFATTKGLSEIRSNAQFDQVECVLELDESFRSFSSLSRVYAGALEPISGTRGEAVARHYGQKLVPGHPLGYRDNQLILGFFHNTPDNTLPVFWYDSPASPWNPVFKRYPKFSF